MVVVLAVVFVCVLGGGKGGDIDYLFIPNHALIVFVFVSYLCSLSLCFCGSPIWSTRWGVDHAGDVRANRVSQPLPTH